MKYEAVWTRVCEVNQVSQASYVLQCSIVRVCVCSHVWPTERMMGQLGSKYEGRKCEAVGLVFVK